ncbi:hypothetical protein A3Q56_02562, partial [Intoshia linei]
MRILIISILLVGLGAEKLRDLIGRTLVDNLLESRIKSKSDNDFDDLSYGTDAHLKKSKSDNDFN